MPKTVPCLWFDGDAEAAAELYLSLFPNSEIQHVSRNGPGAVGEPGAVLTVSFSLDGQPYLALNGGPQYTFSEATSFMIQCADQDEMDHYWYGLTANGGEECSCGWLKDRFGVSWQVTPDALGGLLGDPDPGRAQRAMQAMLGMSRLDLAALRAAADNA